MKAKGRRAGILRGGQGYLLSINRILLPDLQTNAPSWSASRTSWYVYPRAKLLAIGGCLLLCRS